MDAITNLDTATASDHEAVTQLTDTITRLTTELENVNNKLFIAPQGKRKIHVSCGGRNKAARKQGSGAAAKTGSGAPALVAMVRRVDLDPPIHY